MLRKWSYGLDHAILKYGPDQELVIFLLDTSSLAYMAKTVQTSTTSNTWSANYTTYIKYMEC